MYEEKYSRTYQNFERTVSRLQENLEYLEEQGKVSRKFLSMQKLFIKALNDYKEETEQYIAHLEWENMHLSRKMLNEYLRVKKAQEALEAICLIHGIYDLPCWLAKGLGYLVSMAIEHNRENTIQLPSKLMEYMEELNEQDRKKMQELLWKKYNERMKKKMEELTQQLKANINARQ